MTLLILCERIYPILQPDNRVLIYPFEVKNDNNFVGEFVSDVISINLIKSGTCIVLDRSRIPEILSEQGLQNSGCTEANCQVKVGQLLNAEKILTGTIIKFPTFYSIVVRVIDIEKGKIEWAESFKFENLDTIETFIKTYITTLDKEPAQTEKPPPAQTGQTPELYTSIADYERMKQIIDSTRSYGLSVREINFCNKYSLPISKYREFNSYLRSYRVCLSTGIPVLSLGIFGLIGMSGVGNYLVDFPFVSALVTGTGFILIVAGSASRATAHRYIRENAVSYRLIYTGNGVMLVGRF